MSGKFNIEISYESAFELEFEFEFEFELTDWEQSK